MRNLTLLFFFSQETFSLINQRDMRGWTPLHIAVCRDLVEITEYLLQQGADSSMLLSHNSAPCRETPTHVSGPYRLLVPSFQPQDCLLCF